MRLCGRTGDRQPDARARNAAEQAALDLLGQCAAHYIVKSKTVTAGGIELTAELRTKDASTAFVNQISEITGVDSATLVSYNGEYMA